MIKLSAAQIIEATGGTAIGLEGREEQVYADFATTDSREVQTGTLFVAKPGAVTDGHRFIPMAFERGATLALVEREVLDEQGVPYPSIQVPDVVLAMGDLARYSIEQMRAQGELTVVGITGSAGKTTTKDLLAAIFTPEGPTVAPVGSYNSEVGVPLTVFRADESTRYLVIEMGADHVGNIEYLANIAHPDHGAILKVGTAHAGEFGGVDNIERTKGELAEGVQPTGSLALNADDERVLRMASRSVAPITYFGVGEKTDANGQLYERYVAALNLRTTDAGCPEFTMRLPDGSEYEISSQLIGEHHVHNLLAAATIAYNSGISGEKIARALNKAAAASKWRMARTDRADGVTVINDAYNANPESMAAALRTLAQLGRTVDPATGQPHRTWAVLGAMLELGDASVEEHDRIGRLVVRMNISKLIAVGDETKPTYNAAHLEGSWGNEATWVKTPEEAEQILRAEVRPGDIVLFKSSNGAKLGILGDQVAFAKCTFGAEEEQAPTWLSAGDFVETTDLSDHLAAHLDGAASADRTSTEQTANEG
ncbi:UDP-N-acetylmuramoyl-tripeptide--D-alanyl-D-alanine ligase [Rothia sp. P3C3.S176]|uniref:UDP-N-acetylmuramoyl-tripeptide--D-alanyl-D- alanine ligase n=1 Tax=Rothia sp. P3C3.S176 TaxID=2962204 RepID=UPI0020C8B3B5|nr:UDP-N-acetylmuramoyl-tripeptide--D-alanyl-D-alanine ligase [Rothia sp. P3C3.S176]MCP8995632.1 UDP-N-acetylmuramoyl-tripeptide--D-alanyl-D-alanine ligase [Rothia sp. P3C3.S176]